MRNKNKKTKDLSREKYHSNSESNRFKELQKAKEYFVLYLENTLDMIFYTISDLDHNNRQHNKHTEDIYVQLQSIEQRM